MLIFASVAHFFPESLIRPFYTDPLVLAAGVTYLRIVSFSFVPSGITFVTSSLFQGLGNSVPPLISAATRTILQVALIVALSRWPGFSLTWIWWLAVSTIGLQLAMNLGFLRREYRERLFMPAAIA